MFGKKGIVLVLCAFFSLASAFTTSEDDFDRFQRFKNEHLQEVAMRDPQSLAGTQNIFFLSVDEKEWEQIEAILDLYFIGLSSENQQERLPQVQLILSMYNITIRPTNPIGLYHIGRDHVYLDTSLFRSTSNPVYTKSVVFHEKVHQVQNRTFEREIMRIDQRQKYSEKLEEIAAHYLQIRYTISRNDPEAVLMALRNSHRWNMFPSIIQAYPENDEVIKVIKEFLAGLTP